MSDRRFWFGVLLSAGWVLGAVGLLLLDPAKTRAMTPNEWGDFFAGASAPLAFMWLVLGYLQQGDELRLSTRALQLQADELKNSVEQQRELVEVTRQQVESEREALHLERIARHEALRPQFVLKQSGGSFAENRNLYDFYLGNAGNTATNVVVTAEVSSTSHRVIDVPMVARTSEVRGVLKLQQPVPVDGGKMHITYIDLEGKPGTVVFRIEREEDSPHSSLRCTQIEA